MEKHELYTESKKRFNKLEETIGLMNWEQYHDNFKLECWNMYDSQGKPQTYIVQFWQEGAGYSLYKLD